MKKGWWMVLVLVGMVGGQAVQAQGFFNQKKAQKKRLLEQIALLQVYIELLKKGYRIVEDGLNLINDIKHGDFNIHNGYFTSLKNVNPVIKNYSKVNDITDLYQQIAKLYQQATRTAKGALFTDRERDAIERIFAGLLSEANKDLTQLKTLTTAGNFELKDDERLQRIEVLWVDMKDRYAFARDFANSVALLSVQQQREQQDAKGTGVLMDIKE